MTVDDDYTMLGAPVGVVDRDSDPGRGLHSGNEVQLATLGGAGTPVQGERLALVAAAIQARYAARPAVEVAAMPTRLPTSVLPPSQGSRVCLAVDADVVGGVWLDLRDGPLTVFGRTRSGRTSFLRAVAGLARTSDQPPGRVVLVGPRADEWAGDEVFDRVVSDPEDVLRELDALSTDLRERDEWVLLLVDDAHEWERGAEPGGSFRVLCEQIATSITGAQGRSIAVVLAGDPDEARQRQHLAGPVKAARQGRRVMLLAPDLADGTLAGAMVPGATLEPTSGIGRGVLCTGGTVQVVQVATTPESDALMGS